MPISPPAVGQRQVDLQRLVGVGYAHSGADGGNGGRQEASPDKGKHHVCAVADEFEPAAGKAQAMALKIAHLDTCVCTWTLVCVCTCANADARVHVRACMWASVDCLNLKLIHLTTMCCGPIRRQYNTHAVDKAR